MLVSGCICYMEVTAQTKGEKPYETQHCGCSRPVIPLGLKTYILQTRSVVGFRERGSGAVTLGSRV